MGVAVGIIMGSQSDWPTMKEAALILDELGIAYEAKDRLPVHLVVMILSPENIAAEYLQTLGRISRLLKDESIRAKLLQAGSPKTVQQLFSRAA